MVFPFLRTLHPTPIWIGSDMAYIRTHDTTTRRKGKPVKRYVVCWREPVRDAFGLPVPLNPDYPAGAKQMRSRQESYPTREAAELRRDELNVARHTGTTSTLADQRKAGDLPFGFYAAKWVEAQKSKVLRGKLKATTAEDYEALLHRYVLDKFGDRAVSSISPLDCEAFVSALAVRGLAPRTLRNAWGVLIYVLKYATRAGAITANPADSADLGEAKAIGDFQQFEHHPLSAGQIAVLAERVSERYPVYGLAVLFLAYTGVRASEMAGLEVRDIVLTGVPGGGVQGSVRVRRTKARHHGEWITGTPKSKKSIRTVPLPPWLAQRMSAYLADHPRGNDPTAPLWPRRQQGGARRKGEQAVAELDWTEPCDFTTLHDRILRPAMEAVDIPITRAAETLEDGTVVPAVRGTRLHDLRHSFAALQLSAGTHYMQVSKWLGHASYIVTMSVYADWIHEEEERNVLPEPVATRQKSVDDVVVDMRSWR